MNILEIQAMFNYIENGGVIKFHNIELSSNKLEIIFTSIKKRIGGRKNN